MVLHGRRRSRVAFATVLASAAAMLATAAVSTSAAASPEVAQRLDDSVTTPTNGTDYFSYPADWSPGCCFSDLYNGDVHYSRGGTAAQFHFTGTRAVIYGVEDVDQGEASYSVDGGAAKTFDLYRPTRTAQAAVFDTGVLTAGAHTLSITALGTKNTASKDTIVTIDSVVLTGPQQPQSFVVNLGSNTGAFLGGAGGTLYGQYQPGVPSQNLVDGFGEKTLATKAQDGQQHPGADALEVGPSFVAGGGRDEFIYMTDVYRDFPYERTSIQQYQGYLATQVKQAKAAPNAGHIVLIPFNEPDGNWYGGMLDDRDTLHAFESEWLADVQLIKKLWPAARVAGPNTAGYDQDSFIDFLKFAKANNVMPDVVTWHTLGAPSGVDGTVSNFRSAVEPAVGIKNVPVDLDEYAAPVDLDNPAAMVPWIAALERNKVEGDLAYWRVDGTLADSVAQQNTPNAQWWLYNWYSQLSGNTVAVSGPAANADGTGQGVSTLDAAKRQARMILSGGSRPGPANVTFNNISKSIFGDKVHVTVLADRWSGNTGAAAQPDRITDSTIPVINGSVTVPVTLEQLGAYEILLAPGGGSNTTLENPWRASYEAEAATLSPALKVESQTGDATSGGADVTGLKTGANARITFATSVPAAGDYTLRVFGASDPNTADVDGATTIFARADNGTAAPVTVPLSYRSNIWSTVDVTLHLSAGQHAISLATTGDHGAATRGAVSIDRVDLIAEPASTNTYEAEQAALAGGAVPSYSAVGQSGAGTVATPKGASETFWVSAATDGYHDLALRLKQAGTVRLTVNGIPARASTSTRVWTAPVTTAWLQQGINKVVVTGVSGNALVDDLTVRRNTSADRSAVTIQAEAGRTTGIAHIQTGNSHAHGTVVTDIGPGAGNALTLTVPVAAGGSYIATLRFANAQELPSNHYNPDLMSRTALVSINGANPVSVAFGPTYSWDQFFTVGLPLTLKAGTNTMTIWSAQQYDWDGKTVGTVYSGDGGIGSQLRSNQAANIDQVTVAATAR